MFLILRLAREWRNNEREENIIKWLEGIYVTYRAALGREVEYLFHLAVPEGEENKYRELMEELVRLGIVENYMLSKIQQGYYTASWARYYDFIHHTWREKPIDVEMHKVPLTTNRKPDVVDEIDLRILLRLELNPRKTNLEISKELGISPQLVSYHRQKHIEGQGIITGYVPTWTIRQDNVISGVMLLPEIVRNNLDLEDNDGLIMDHFLHLSAELTNISMKRIILPAELVVNKLSQTKYLQLIHAPSAVQFAIPLEHHETSKWTSLETFLTIIDEVVRKIIAISPKS